MLDQFESSKEHKEATAKKARPRACDQCRRRKVRCNGGELPVGERCYNCVAFEYECIYTELPSNKRFTDPEYVKGLENEVAELKKQLNLYSEEITKLRSLVADRSDMPSPVDIPPEPVLDSPKKLVFDAQSQSENETEDHEGLVELLKSMNLNVKHTHFVGRSSSMTFVRAALALKEEYIASGDGVTAPENDGKTKNRDPLDLNQPEFYEATARLIQPDPPHPPSAFPPQTLLPQLIDAYFCQLNDAYPLIHRPSFERSLGVGLHLRDEAFGSTVLLVCAIGARFFNDPAMLPEGTKSWHWAGWHWFQRTNWARKVVHVSAPRVYDLQVCALFALYIGMSPVTHAVYSIVGYGLRLAKDLGIHRRGTYGPRLTVDDELKRRAFWCLVAFDRTTSDKLGRPYNVHDEDFDVDFPAECDDEYWIIDNQELRFAQPPDKPSKIIAFNCMLRLTRIHAEAFRAMYSLRPSRVSSDPEEVQVTLLDMESKLNEFIDSIPPHLKWDPKQENVVFLGQSGLLYTCYYFLQILIHRPFVPLPKRPSNVSSSSLAVCTNAARCCIRVVDVQIARTGQALFPHVFWQPLTLFTSATVLLLNVWNAKKQGLSNESARDLRYVQKANHILQGFEKHWLGAARLWYILRDVTSVVTKSTPYDSEQRKRKREDTLVDQCASGSSSASTQGSQLRVHHVPQSIPLGLPSHLQTLPHGNQIEPSESTPFNFALSMHSSELGGLPDWSSTPDSGAAAHTPEGWADPYINSPEYFGSENASAQAEVSVDPDLEAIFEGLFPDMGYNSMFGSFGVPWAGTGSGSGGDHDVMSGQFHSDAYATDTPTRFTSGEYGASSSSTLDRQLEF